MKVGDKVIMTEGANRNYGITKEGSIGKLLWMSSNGQVLRIDFTRLTGDPTYPLPYITDVEARFVKTFVPIEELMETKKKILSEVM